MNYPQEAIRDYDEYSIALSVVNLARVFDLPILPFISILNYCIRQHTFQEAMRISYLQSYNATSAQSVNLIASINGLLLQREVHAQKLALNDIGVGVPT